MDVLFQKPRITWHNPNSANDRQQKIILDGKKLDNDELLQFCRQHRRSATLSVNENVVWLIHPFFPVLYDDFTQHDKTEQLQTFLTNLNGQYFSVVLLDSPEHYAIKSHKLVEQGVVNQVVFTKNARGEFYPGETELLNKFKTCSHHYIAGSYREFCVYELGKLIKKQFDQAEIGFKVIRDLSVYALYTPLSTLLTPKERSRAMMLHGCVDVTKSTTTAQLLSPDLSRAQI